MEYKEEYMKMANELRNLEAELRQIENFLTGELLRSGQKFYDAIGGAFYLHKFQEPAFSDSLPESGLLNMLNKTSIRTFLEKNLVYDKAVMTKWINTGFNNGIYNSISDFRDTSFSKCVINSPTIVLKDPERLVVPPLDFNLSLENNIDLGIVVFEKINSLIIKMDNCGELLARNYLAIGCLEDDELIIEGRYKFIRDLPVSKYPSLQESVNVPLMECATLSPSRYTQLQKRMNKSPFKWRERLYGRFYLGKGPLWLRKIRGV